MLGCTAAAMLPLQARGTFRKHTTKPSEQVTHPVKSKWSVLLHHPLRLEDIAKVEIASQEACLPLFADLFVIRFGATPLAL